jgi:hydrogenase maturation protease
MTRDNLYIKSPERIVIMGMGNLLLKDEGVGVHVIHVLRKKNLPKNVELVDAGTATLDVLQMLSEVDKLIVIDAVKGGCASGTIYKFKPSNICSTNRTTISLHQLGFIEALSIVEKLGKAPMDVTIIGIEPMEIAIGLELSPEIAERIPKIIQLVSEMICNQTFLPTFSFPDSQSSPRPIDRQTSLDLAIQTELSEKLVLSRQFTN